MMKKLATIIFILGVLSFAYPLMAFTKSEFCAGFERGYTAGYKKGAGADVAPFTPFCPPQPLKGFDAPDSDFEHGFIVGYEQGISRGSDLR